MASHNIYFLLTLFCFFFAIQASPTPLTEGAIFVNITTPNLTTPWKVKATMEPIIWYVIRVGYNVLTAENSMIQGLQAIIPLRIPRIVSF